MEGVSSVESPGKVVSPPAFSLSSGGSDAPPSDSGGSGGGGIKRVGAEATSLELLGSAGANLTYEFALKYGQKLITEHNPLPEIAILVGDVIMHFFGPAISSAEGMMTKLAQAGLSMIAPALKWVELARTIISRITQFIDRIPAPIREFLKYVMGFGVKKFGDIASRLTNYLGTKLHLSPLQSLSKQFLIEDATINTIIFTASSMAGSVTKILAILDTFISALQSVTRLLTGIIETGGKFAAGAFTVVKFAYRFLRGTGTPETPQAEGGQAQASSEQTPSTAPEEPKGADIDLKFLRLLVASPTVQRWQETVKDKPQEKGGIVLSSQLQLLLGSLDYRADVTIKIDYAGAFDFNLESETPLFADGIGFDGLFNLKGLSLTELGMRSGEGMYNLKMDLEKLSFGNNVLVGSNLSFTYDKNADDPIQLSAPDIELNAFGKSFGGGLNLGFADTGRLNSGDFSIMDKKPIELFGDHLKLANLTVDGEWEARKFKSLAGQADVILNLPRTTLRGNKFQVKYETKDGLSAEAASMALTLDVLGATVTVDMLNPHLDKDGFGAEKVTFEFTKPKPGEEGPQGDPGQAEKQASFLKTAVPGFDLSWITAALDVEHFQMQVSNARIGENAKARTADSSGQPTAETPASQTPSTGVQTPVVSGESSTPVVSGGSGTPAVTPAPKRNEFRLNALKATAFGFHVDGAYQDDTKKFAGTIESKSFGLEKGDTPATFSVGKNAAGDQFEADVQNLQWKNVNPFGLFKAGSINVTQLKLVSGLGIQALGITIKKLDFGDGTVKVEDLTGTLTESGLEITGSAIQFSLFGQAMTGGFSIKVDRSGKPKEIKAKLAADTDINAIPGMLSIKGVGGELEWKDGKLQEAGIHGDLNLALKHGITAKSTGLKFGYLADQGMYAEAQELRMNVDVSEKLQLMLVLTEGRVAKGADGIGFKAKQVAASLSYGKPIFSDNRQNVSSENLNTLIPAIDPDWLNFVGLEAIGFTLSADEVLVSGNALKVTKWNKVLDVFKAKVAGLEFGYDKDGSQLESQAESARRVEQPSVQSQDPSSQPRSGGPVSADGQSASDPSRQARAVGGDPSTPVAQKGPGAWAKGTWGDKWSIPALNMSVPILPGINVGGSLEMGAGISATVGAGMTKLASEGKKDRYEMDGLAEVKAEGTIKAGLHASLGSEFIFAIQAGLFAQAKIDTSAKGKATGIIIWDNATNRPALSTTASERPKINVDLKTTLSASIGAEVKARAFLIFEKKLWTYTFKTWEMGEWSLKGSFEADADGNYKFKKTLSGFGSDEGLPTSKPQMQAEVVSPETFLNDKDGKITDKYMAYRIYHDIEDPTFGYSDLKQAALIEQLMAREDVRRVSFDISNPKASNLKDSMVGKAARPNKGMMANGEWEAYSTTKGTVSGIKDRKTIKGVDAKLAVYNGKRTDPDRIQALRGTLTDAEVHEKLAGINLEDAVEASYARSHADLADVYSRAGLIQICDVYLLRNGKKNRAEMVAKLRMDATRELDRLLTPPPPIARVE